MAEAIICPQCNYEQCITIRVDTATWFKCANCGCIFDADYTTVVSSLCHD